MRGFTLVELVMGMGISSILVFVIGGLVFAVQQANSLSQNLEAVTTQAQASIDRIEFMVSHAGTYRGSNGTIQPGIAIVTRQLAGMEFPEILVIWSGGREGGMADAGTLDRLPLVSEMIVYTYDPEDASRLVEIAFPNVDVEVDFTDDDFGDRVRAGIHSDLAESILLCDRLSMTDLSQDSSSLTGIGHMRFEMETSPSDGDLSGINPGTEAWNNLRWAQGISTSSSGIRQTNVRIELQLSSEPVNHAETDEIVAIPFFGSVSHRHVYHP